MIIRPQHCIWLAFILAFMACPTVGLSQNILLEGELRVQESMDDNVNYEGKTDLVTSIQPSLSLQGGTPETTWTLSGGLDYQTHKEQYEKDRTNRNLDLNLTRAFTPRLSGALATSLALDNSTEESLEEFAIVVTPTKRITTSIAPSASFAVNETNSVSLSGSFSKRQADSDNVADQTITGANLGWSWRYSEVSSFIISSAYTNNESNSAGRETTQRVSRISVGYERQWTENLSSTFNFGPSLSDTTVDFNTGQELNTTQRSYYVDGGLSWTRERSSYALSINREQTQSTLGDPTTRVAARLNSNFKWTERFSSSLALSYTYSDSESAGESQESQEYRVSPSINYQLAEDLGVRFSYEYSLREDMTDDETNSRNKMTLSLNKTFSKLFD